MMKQSQSFFTIKNDSLNKIDCEHEKVPGTYHSTSVTLLSGKKTKYL